MIDPHLLPEPIVGEVSAVTPIHMGLSGAAVYAVTGSRGEFILRLQGDRFDETYWQQHLTVLRRASSHGIAPELLHVDDAAHAMLTRKIAGPSLPATLGDPQTRTRAIASVIDRLRALHAMDTSGIAERDGVTYLRRVWTEQRERRGFPQWADNIGDLIESLTEQLSRDRRRVLSHNDVNPGNVLWDGARAWLIDWEVAGLSHPYFDVASLATFLNLDRAPGLELLWLHEQAPIDQSAADLFDALRRLAATMSGCTILGMVDDLTQIGDLSREETATLGAVYAGMRTGAIRLQERAGQLQFGLALLRAGTERAEA